MSLERGWKPDPEKPFPGKVHREWFRAEGCKKVSAKSTRKSKREHTRRSRLHQKRTTVRELKHWKETPDGEIVWY